MIQRAQSVYLLLITVLMSFLIFRPYAELTLADGHTLIFKILTIKSYTSPNNWIVLKHTLPLFLLILGAGILSFVNIFLYSNRVLQMRLCLIDSAVLIVVLLIMFAYYTVLRAGNDHTLHAFRLGAIFPIMAIILNVMAYRSIHHDQMLVESYDRIR